MAPGNGVAREVGAMSATRDALHRMIDEVSESELEHVTYLLKYHRRADRDPFLFALAIAPYDDEPETPGEAAAVAEAREALACGDVVSLDDLKRELGP
jgi:hypothetical protein